MLVVIVEVSGDIDVRLKWYSTPVSLLVALCSHPVGSLRKCVTLSVSSSLKKSIPQCRVVDSVTVQVKLTSGKTYYFRFRANIQSEDWETYICTQSL